MPNALDRSRAASYNQGNRWRIVPFEREVPAGKTKLALRAIQASVMPAATIFRSVFMSGEPEVRGTAEFELKPGQVYRVNGHLDDFKREVWLEEEGGPIVGSKISLSADPALVKAMEGASYVTTNLRYSGDWISDDPAIGLPIVPVGARMKVIEFRKDRASVLIDGRKMRVGIDRPSGETIQEFVARITSADDPRPRLASLPDDPRAAVAAGRVLPGMSREQIVMALGRPRIDQVRSLEQTEWPYRFDSEDSEILLIFGASGRLERRVAQGASRHFPGRPAAHFHDHDNACRWCRARSGVLAAMNGRSGFGSAKPRAITAPATSPPPVSPAH